VRGGGRDYKGEDNAPELRANLVTALSSLKVHNLTHSDKGVIKEYGGGGLGGRGAGKWTQRARRKPGGRATARSPGRDPRR